MRAGLSLNSGLEQLAAAVSNRFVDVKSDYINSDRDHRQVPSAAGNGCGITANNDNVKRNHNIGRL